MSGAAHVLDMTFRPTSNTNPLNIRESFAAVNTAADIIRNRVESLTGRGRTAAEDIELISLSDDLNDLDTFLSLAGAGFAAGRELRAAVAIATPHLPALVSAA